MHGPADAARLGIGIIHQELEVDRHARRRRQRLPRAASRVGRAAAAARSPAHGGRHRAAARPASARDLAAHARAAAVHRAAAVRRDRPRPVDERAAARSSTSRPSASRSSEAERLFAVLHDLRAAGTAIVYISHRLKEIEALADRVVVLRDGRNAGVLDARRDHARSSRAADGRPRDRAGGRAAARRRQHAHRRTARLHARSASARGAIPAPRCR